MWYGVYIDVHALTLVDADCQEGRAARSEPLLPHVRACVLGARVCGSPATGISRAHLCVAKAGCSRTSREATLALCPSQATFTLCPSQATFTLCPSQAAGPT